MELILEECSHGPDTFLIYLNTTQRQQSVAISTKKHNVIMRQFKFLLYLFCWFISCEGVKVLKVKVTNPLCELKEWSCLRPNTNRSCVQSFFMLETNKSSSCFLRDTINPHTGQSSKWIIEDGRITPLQRSGRGTRPGPGFRVGELQTSFWIFFHFLWLKTALRKNMNHTRV